MTTEPEKKVVVTEIRHGHANSYLKGTFTPGMTSKEVRLKIDGTFGGTFTYFDQINGVFHFTAYND